MLDVLHVLPSSALVVILHQLLRTSRYQFVFKRVLTRTMRSRDNVSFVFFLVTLVYLKSNA